MASAIFYLGVPIQDVPRARLYAPAGRSPHAPNRPYAVIHPVAATEEKTWPYFPELASRLPVEPVFIGAAGEDLSRFHPSRTVIGASIPEIAQLMRDADFFIGNDSGPAHIAAAFGLPVTVLFGPSDAEIWSPWRTQARVLQSNPISGITLHQVVGQAFQPAAGLPPGVPERREAHCS
jgi:ADP-heptose:LPS heptosyltransferase